MRKAALHLAVVATYALLMTLVSLMPGNASEQWFPHVDKLLHLGAYAAFAILCAPIWWQSGNIQRTTLITLMLLCLFGGTMEIAQTLVPNRDASWLDMLANSLGLILGWAVSNGIKKARIWRAFVDN
ncbi:MAG: VanZ family protein [Pseudomonadales bacterium]